MALKHQDSGPNEQTQCQATGPGGIQHHTQRAHNHVFHIFDTRMGNVLQAN